MNVQRSTVLLPPLAALLLLLLTVACSEEEPTGASTTIPRVTVVADEYHYDMPAEIPTGLVTLSLQNQGAEPHHAQVARLNPGVTQAQLMQWLREDPEGAAASLLTFAGGPASVSPGGSQDVTVDLAPGAYVMLCFVPGPDGVPHLASGMIHPFQVTGPPSAAAPPPDDAGVELRDFAFTVPDLTAEPTTIQVTNTGAQVHEMVFAKVAEGKTAADALTFLSTLTGPPPFTHAGGMQALAPGTSGWLTADLDQGNYVMYCVVPDPESRRPHVALGMFAEFTVD